MTRPLAILLLACASALPSPTRAQGEAGAEDFVLKAGKVIPITGDEIAPGMVVVRGGRIAAVGRDLAVPEGLRVLDVGDRVVMPGFVEAHSHRGLDGTYETAANASFVRVTDALNMVSLEVEDARRNGITTMLVAPDHRAFLAGRAAVVRPRGVSVDSAIIIQDAALKISLQPSGGSSRMGHLSKLRQILDETRRYLDEREGRAPDARGDVDSAREGLVALLQDSMPAHVYCPTAEDVAAAFALGSEYGFRVVPVIPPEAWRAVPLLAANHVTVVVTPSLETWERQPDGSVEHVEIARLLWESKIPFALTTSPYELGPQHPWYQAALAVRQGVPRDVALRAITRVPARLLGFGSRKGVLEPGADADLLVLSADPLSGRAFVDEVYAAGARVYAREADAKLQRLLAPGTGEPPLVAAEADHHEDDDAPHEAPDGTPEREREQRWPAGAPQ